MCVESGSPGSVVVALIDHLLSLYNVLFRKNLKVVRAGSANLFGTWALKSASLDSCLMGPGVVQDSSRVIGITNRIKIMIGSKLSVVNVGSWLPINHPHHHR